MEDKPNILGVWMKTYLLATTLGVVILAADEQQPTTIIGAFIALAMLLAGLVSWALKKQMDDAKEERRQNAESAKADRAEFTAAIKALEEGKRLQSVAEDTRIDKLIESQDRRIDRVMDRIVEQQEAQRKHDATQTATLHASIIEAATNMRAAVHDVRGVAQATVAKADEVVQQIKHSSSGGRA